MGRKKKEPTFVLSARISKRDYEKIKAIAKTSGKTISQIYREMIHQSKRRNIC